MVVVVRFLLFLGRELKFKKMSAVEIQELFENAFSIVATCYLIGFSIGIIIKVYWKSH